jgi:hypothetical protein
MRREETDLVLFLARRVRVFVLVRAMLAVVWMKGCCLVVVGIEPERSV